MKHAMTFAPDMAVDAYEAEIEEIIARTCANGVANLVATR
jgi:hypothetical protein